MWESRAVVVIVVCRIRRVSKQSREKGLALVGHRLDGLLSLLPRWRFHRRGLRIRRCRRH